MFVNPHAQQICSWQIQPAKRHRITNAYDQEAALITIVFSVTAPFEHQFMNLVGGVHRLIETVSRFFLALVVCMGMGKKPQRLSKCLYNTQPKDSCGNGSQMVAALRCRTSCDLVDTDTSAKVEARLLFTTWQTFAASAYPEGTQWLVMELEVFFLHSLALQSYLLTSVTLTNGW